jgi:hypothetical protein
MVGEDYSATTESAWLLHDWAPVAEKFLKVATARTISTGAGSDDFLWDDTTQWVSLFW